MALEIDSQRLYEVARWMYAIGILGVLLMIVFHILHAHQLQALWFSAYLLLILWLGRAVRFW